MLVDESEAFGIVECVKFATQKGYIVASSRADAANNRSSIRARLED